MRLGRQRSQLCLVALIFLAAVMTQSTASQSQDDSEARPPVSKSDVEIVKRARQILSSPEKWNRADNRNCPDTETKFSLYCALEKATYEVTGDFAHRGAAMQEARMVIDEDLAPKNNFEHRLMNYNNDPRTTFADVQRFFDLLEARIEGRLEAQEAKATLPSRATEPSATNVAAAPRASEIEFTPPSNVPGHSAWIPLRHQEQESNLCVPTSASIILEYFGQQVSPREIKELSMGRRYSPDMPFDDFTITLFRDLVSGLDRIGYSWKQREYPDNRKGLQQGLAQIEHSLDAGIPVMIDTTPVGGNGAGHTFVIAGYSVSQEALYVVDPNRPSPGTRTVGFEELESIWNSRGVNFDKRGAVFPRRRRGKKQN